MLIQKTPGRVLLLIDSHFNDGLACLPELNELWQRGESHGDIFSNLNPEIGVYANPYYDIFYIDAVNHLSFCCQMNKGCISVTNEYSQKIKEITPQTRNFNLVSAWLKDCVFFAECIWEGD